MLQQMHKHYKKDYILRLSKRSRTDEEAKGVASGTADSETPDGRGGGVGEAGGDWGIATPSNLLAWMASRTNSEIRLYVANKCNNQMQQARATTRPYTTIF